MWWGKATAVALLAFSISGCGFEPLYGERSRTADPALAAIHVEPIPERMGQLLRISLRDSFNPTGERAETKYFLSTVLNYTRRELGTRPDGTATRLQVELVASWSLRDGKQPLMTTTARSFSALDLTDNEYANLSAEQAAQERMVRDISDQIRTRVRAYLTTRTAA